ncbi:MAG: phosphotransferase family protein [Betaproteobacteria bacterium]|nr:MAG: phosphotransferase family protein [Betaproteobacteria bacterium]
MAVSVPDRREVLQHFLAEAKGEPGLKIAKLTKLAGGTVQQNWRVDVEWPGGAASWVLRTAEALGVEDSLAAAEEYEVMRAAHAAGVKLPAPLWSCVDPTVLGQDFFVVDFLDGMAEPHKLFGASLDGQREAIIEQVGEQLGRLQAVVPKPGVLPFLKPPPENVALDTIANLRDYLDSHELPHPAIEFGLRWLERNAPPPEVGVLCHGDFRTGNYMVKDGRLQGILDWELGHWGDPHEDLGWLCQRFFRFGKVRKEAGGMADRRPLLRGYERASGRRVDPEVMAYWDIMANVKWAVVSLQQAARYTSGAVDAFELALVGLGTAEMEMEALDLIGSREGLCHA